MMPLQRACDAESQVRNKLSNGPLRAQSNVIFTEYSATLQAGVILPGICWYPAKCTVIPWIQGGTADCVVLFIEVRDSSLTDRSILSGTFFYDTLFPISQKPSGDAHSREEELCRKRSRSARECAKAHSLFCSGRKVKRVFLTLEVNEYENFPCSQWS